MLHIIDEAKGGVRKEGGHNPAIATVNIRHKHIHNAVAKLNMTHEPMGERGDKTLILLLP